LNEWLRTLRRFARNRKAISGLETAIVLIAFVIVASAFAYAVLNMGFLATQKSQQVVLGGPQAASALVVDGPVFGYSAQTGPNANITSIIFWLKTAAGADSVDLGVNRTTIGFQNPRGYWTNIYNTGGSTLTYTLSGTTYLVSHNATTISWEIGQGMMLSAGQRVRVTIDLTLIHIGNGANTSAQVARTEEFKLLVKPVTGAVLEIDRTAPGGIALINDLG
jgi:flagellin FlaB